MSCEASEVFHVVRFVMNSITNPSKTRPLHPTSKLSNDWVLWSPGVVIMKRFHSLMLPLATVGVLMFPTLLPAASLDPVDSMGVQVQRQEQNGVVYLSGGIGEDEAKAIQQTTGYNLHMTFSTGPKDEYVPDVDVVVEKAPGHAVLKLNQAGPLVYAQLPPGKYTVVATRNGVTRSDTTDVGSNSARNLVFHWNDAE